MRRWPRSFACLAWSNLSAQIAEQIALAAAPLIAVLMFAAGEGATGLLQAAQTLPFLLFCLPAGVLADRVSRRRLLISGEAVRLLALLAIIGLIFSDSLSLPLLAVLGMVGATGTVVFSVAGPALVPSLVGRGALAAANSRIELARSIAFAAGPALGGVLVGSVGVAWAFGIAALFSAVAVMLMSGIQESPAGEFPRRKPLQELSDGARFVVTHTLLRPILLTAIFFNLGFFILQAVYVPYAVHHLNLSASGVGATLAVSGIGMVGAALVGPRVMRRWSFGRVILVGPFAGLAASIVMLCSVWWPAPWLAGLSFLLIGAGPVIWVISSTTLRQAVTPPQLLGRASAVIMTATFGARPLGALIGAAVGSLAGAPWCLALAVVAFAVQAIVIVASPLSSLREVPAGTGPPARARWLEPRHAT